MSVNVSEFQRQTGRTMPVKPERPLTDGETMILWAAFGVAGEAGEVVEVIKKALFHQHGLNQDELANEIGALLWCIAALCEKTGLNMEQVMQQNNRKLQRYPNGFAPQDSRTRVDVGHDWYFWDEEESLKEFLENIQ